MGTHDKRTTLAEALFTKTQRALLPILFGHPEEAFYLRELVRRCDVGVGTVQRELAKLVAAGILRRTARGGQVFYQVARDCPVYPELRELTLKTLGAAQLLRQALAPLKASVVFAFIFGSMARGEESSASDVDVMLVGDVSFGEVVKHLLPVQEELSREINPILYEPAEFAEKIRRDAHFVRRVLQSPRTMLIGDEHELADLAAERVAG